MGGILHNFIVKFLYLAMWLASETAAHYHCVADGVQCGSIGWLPGRTNGCHERGSRRELVLHLYHAKKASIEALD